MDIKFGKSIAEKLGLVDPIEKTETQGDLSARDAALAAKRGGWRVNTQRPTGYARTVRRAQARADAGQDRKMSKRRTRRQRQEADVIDYAGSIARVYFDENAGSPALRRAVVQRVLRQADAIAGGRLIHPPVALAEVEDQLRVNLQRMEAVQSERALATQKRRAQVVQARKNKRQLATYAESYKEPGYHAHPGRELHWAPLGTAMPR